MLLEGMHRRLSLFGGAVLWLGHGRREAEQGRIDKNSAARQGSRGGVLLAGDSKYRFCRNASQSTHSDCKDVKTPAKHTHGKVNTHRLHRPHPPQEWMRGRCARVVLARARPMRGGCGPGYNSSRRRRPARARRTRGQDACGPGAQSHKGAPNSSARPDKGGGATKGETPWLHPTSPAAAS